MKKEIKEINLLRCFVFIDLSQTSTQGTQSTVQYCQVWRSKVAESKTIVEAQHVLILESLRGRVEKSFEVKLERLIQAIFNY